MELLYEFITHEFQNAQPTNQTFIDNLKTSYA
jgi:hypothetical protein